jgi:hypothetical protein
MCYSPSLAARDLKIKKCLVHQYLKLFSSFHVDLKFQVIFFAVMLKEFHARF